MQDGPDLDPIDETFEAGAALKLTLRGLALALVAGLIWHFPTGYMAVKIPLGIIAAFVLLYAIMPLAPAALVFRNITGRWLGLWGWQKTLFALGIAIFAMLLVLAALIFRLAGAAYG